MPTLSHGAREAAPDFDLPQGAPPQAAALPAAGVRELDARPLAAPLPLLQARRVLRGMRAGDELRVITGYHGSLDEFQALAKFDIRLELVSQDIAGEVFVHLLRKRR